MEKFYIKGPVSLKGTVNISGSKNAVLPILFSSLLAEKPVKIKNFPNIKDVINTIKILRKLGVKVKINESIYIDASNIKMYKISYSLGKVMRASILALGPLLARFKKGEVSFPGGCNIGSRPINLHLQGLKKLGAKIKLEKEFIKASTNNRLNGANIFMKKISVGATVNIMSAATLANGITIIENAAKEPEVLDTAKFLITLGAKIYGAGTDKIIIKGVKKLGGGIYRILPDRIETGTFLIAATISKGKIICRYTKPENLKIVIKKLREAGAYIQIGENWISLDMKGKRPKALKISTAPYPGFPTDLQAQFSILNFIARGKGIIRENIFENRFMHVPELIRMGAKARIINNNLICKGVKKLFGANVLATDLRASISLVLAGCIAQGTTVVKDIHHIDRGYDRIEEKLRKINANIIRIVEN